MLMLSPLKLRAILTRSFDEDSWVLRELAERIDAKESREAPQKKSRASGAALVVMNAVNYALEVTGRTGKEVLYSMLERQYGVVTEEIILKPGPFMSALSDLLGPGAHVLEREMLGYIRAETGVVAHNLEEATDLLRKSEGTGWHVG